MTDTNPAPLPDGWEEQPYDESDEAPPFYNDADHDCDGTDGDEHEGDDGANGHAVIRGGAGNAQDRGWGPPCSGQIVTIVRADGVKLPVRHEVKVLIALLCDETERRGYNLVPGWCWGYACRKIRGSSTWSNHAWGLAVDLNAPTNPMTSRLITDMPGWMPELWNSFGFRWGGDYSGRKDAMHYEFVGSPADAAEMTRKAQLTLAGQEDDVSKDQVIEALNQVKPADLDKESALYQVWAGLYEKKGTKFVEATDEVKDLIAAAKTEILDAIKAATPTDG